ncbi:MAG: hypothetical protein QM811_25005 [Pirellulales bacterium]
MHARRDAWIDEFAAPDVRASWDQFRKDAKAQTGEAGTGPVKRREPKSPEPPLLVLLRDHFPVIQAATVIFGSAVLIFFAIVVRGITRSPASQLGASDDSRDSGPTPG